MSKYFALYLVLKIRLEAIQKRSIEECIGLQNIHISPTEGIFFLDPSTATPQKIPFLLNLWSLRTPPLLGISNNVWGGGGWRFSRTTQHLNFANDQSFPITMKQNLDSNTILFLFQLVYVIVVE